MPSWTCWIAVLQGPRLGDQASQDVRPSARLTESAVCLVADEQGMDMRLERFLQQHQQLDQLSKRVLEINPKHELIRQMAALAADDAQQAELGDLAELLLDQARIVEGRAAARPWRLLPSDERVPRQGTGGLSHEVATLPLIEFTGRLLSR